MHKHIHAHMHVPGAPLGERVLHVHIPVHAHLDTRDMCMYVHTCILGAPLGERVVPSEDCVAELWSAAREDVVDVQLEPIQRVHLGSEW